MAQRLARRVARRLHVVNDLLYLAFAEAIPRWIRAIVSTRMPFTACVQTTRGLETRIIRGSTLDADYPQYGVDIPRRFTPTDAKAAAVNSNALTLTLPFRSMEIPLEEIETVEMQDSWCWRTIRIRCASGKKVVSGLSLYDVKALADALVVFPVGLSWGEARRFGLDRRSESRQSVSAVSTWTMRKGAGGGNDEG